MSKPNETIVVADADLDQYGNLHVVDENGNEHKIGAKRAHLFTLFTAGATVELSYDNYQNKDYISGAKVVGTKSAPQSSQSPQSQSSPASSSIETQVAFKGVVELLTAKVINDEHPLYELAIKWAVEKLGGQVEPEEIPF